MDNQHTKPTEPQCSREYVTPRIAAEWLKRNTSNRTVIAGRVAWYKKQIESGSWGATHEGVAFGTNGVLLDGQHRLLAIVDANIPVWMWVFYDIDPDARRYMDAGIPRRMQDRIDVTKEDASIINFIHYKNAGGRYQPTVAQAQEILVKYSDGLAWLRSNWRPRPFISRAPVRVAVMELWMKDHEKGESFLCAYLDGSGDPTDPARKLWTHCMTVRNGKLTDIYNRARSACDAHLKGRTLSRLHCKGAKRGTVSCPSTSTN